MSCYNLFSFTALGRCPTRELESQPGDQGLGRPTGRGRSLSPRTPEDGPSPRVGEGRASGRIDYFEFGYFRLIPVTGGSSYIKKNLNFWILRQNPDTKYRTRPTSPPGRRPECSWPRTSVTGMQTSSHLSDLVNSALNDSGLKSSTYSGGN